MLLEGKNAVIYGGGGAIGGAVARAFAREGARVFLAGRTMAHLEEVAARSAAPAGRPRQPRSTRSGRTRSTPTPTRWRRGQGASTSA